MNLTVLLEGKIRPFSLSIILGAAAFGILLIAVAPKFDQLRINGRVLSELQKAVEILETKLSSLETLDENSQAETLETVLAALPLEEPYREVLLNLDTLLARYQIGASKIKIESLPDSLSVKFLSTGPIAGVRNFITDVGAILPISAAVSIQAVRVSDISASDSASVYQTEIAVKIFFKPPPKFIGRDIDPLPQITADHLKTLSLLSEFEKIPPLAAGPETDTGGAARLFPE